MAFPKDKDKPGYKSKHPDNKTKIDAELIKEAIRKTRGNISRAADKLGVCRDTLHSRINADSSIKAVVDSCRERFLDETEDVFQNKVLSGDTVSLLFALKTLGRKRGYDVVERDVIAESATRGALEFIFNRSKSPVDPS